MNRPRQRPLSIGPLRAFEAVARRLGFRAAADELHLTQPAVSRQIRALEEEIGLPLFLRGTRHVELTSAGEALLRTVAPLLDRLDATVRQIRSVQGRRQVNLTTWPSFASMWLLPRLQQFQREQPGIDIRVSAQDAIVDFDDPELDLALRYCHPDNAPPGSTRMFGEVVTPVASPALGPLTRPEDLAQMTLLEEDSQLPSVEYLSWRHWLAAKGVPQLEPRGWLYLNYTYQQIQAATAGQGVALARLALVRESLARGELVEPFGPAGRLRSPFAYWLVRWPSRRERPELAAFETWVLEQAEATRSGLDDEAAAAG
ncbi:LysR family transcriptional regulator [Rubrivivax gelatinosus]|nr:LysR family transcriptional regulator [Rubrivivax gelatinosus]